MRKGHGEANDKTKAQEAQEKAYHQATHLLRIRRCVSKDVIDETVEAQEELYMSGLSEREET